MLFQVVEKDEFRKLMELILQTNEVVGPKQVAISGAGKPIHQYLPVNRFDEIDLSYSNTEYSAKTYFLPFKENLSTFCFEDGDWEQQINYRMQPRALVGLHACDINALLRLDKVMTREFFPSPYYRSRRQNTFIIGIDHEPCDKGFCQSLGTSTVTHGFDLFLNDLGDRYFVKIASDRGFAILQRVKVLDPSEKDRKEYIEVKKRFANNSTFSVDVRNLSNVLDIEFESEVWKKWGDKCLSCGSCAMVCPTCYCYGVTEKVTMDHTSATKVKQLYSCNLVDFATVAGGHNFRPHKGTRLKYRYYHQHRGFMEAYEEAKCVGCGRCSNVCLAGINPPEVIRDLQAEVRT
jgi:formate hydrogenlyase subunit 6/NADH:ubiquinone oxidoreductase subunit I